jgi:hypothetical protein
VTGETGGTGAGRHGRLCDKHRWKGTRCHPDVSARRRRLRDRRPGDDVWSA